MFSKRKITLFSLAILLIFSFKQADDYFEISKNLEIFSTVYKTVNNDYVDEVNPGQLMKIGIDAMLSSLDPYTVYYSESQAEDAMIMQSGEYGGVGCRSRKIGKYVCITSVRKGLPADIAGLRIGDKILEINGKSFEDKSDDDVSQAIKGAPNSKVRFTIERQGQIMNFDVVRQEIKMSNVSFYQMIDSSTGYIRLDHFMQGAAFEVKNALLELKKEGMRKLIFDLRDNGGGLLHEAVGIVNIFVDYNQSVVISKGKSSEAYREYKTLDRVTDPNIPLVVLVNDHSASASEIVCGAIQDFDRGVIIGRNTFGKGLVQNVKPLSFRSQMKVTIAKYYIPSGRCIQLLDYGNKDKNGKPTILADSLRKKFTTKNGRVVLDGGGVKPDITVELKPEPSIIENLERSNIIYDFANSYRFKNEGNFDVNTFQITDQIFNDFKTFANKQTFSSLNASEQALKTLKEKLKENNYDKAAQIEIDALEKAIAKAKSEEIDAHKKEICDKLLLEISTRYLYEEAPFILSFMYDKDIKIALKTINNRVDMNNILGK